MTPPPITAPFFVHGPKLINGLEMYMITEGKENGVPWAICNKKEHAEFIASLLQRVYENKKFNDTWSNSYDDMFEFCSFCNLSYKIRPNPDCGNSSHHIAYHNR